MHDSNLGKLNQLIKIDKVGLGYTKINKIMAGTPSVYSNFDEKNTAALTFIQLENIYTKLAV